MSKFKAIFTNSLILFFFGLLFQYGNFKFILGVSLTSIGMLLKDIRDEL